MSKFSQQLVENVRIELLNDPEKFSAWEHSFVENLVDRKEQYEDALVLTLGQIKKCNEIMKKAEEA